MVQGTLWSYTAWAFYSNPQMCDTGTEEHSTNTELTFVAHLTYVCVSIIRHCYVEFSISS